MFNYLSDGIITVAGANYSKYKKLKLLSVCKLGHVYYCETEHEYLWVEARMGNIVLDKAETSYEIGNEAEVVAKYKGDDPSFFELVEHFNWKVDEENIWNG